MIVGKEYIVEYGTTQQRMSSRGLEPHYITVIRFGDNREMDFYKSLKRACGLQTIMIIIGKSFFTFIDFCLYTVQRELSSDT